MFGSEVTSDMLLKKPSGFQFSVLLKNEFQAVVYEPIVGIKKNKWYNSVSSKIHGNLAGLLILLFT